VVIVGTGAGRGVRVDGIKLGVGVSVGNSGVGVSDDATVGKSIAVGEARTLVGDNVEGTGAPQHPVRDTSRTKGNK
jgi:hypothetical protein